MGNSKEQNFFSHLFTCFIPAPKQSRLAYQEKVFDQIINQILQLGPTAPSIESIQTQVIESKNTAGLWILTHLKLTSREQIELVEKTLDEYFSRSLTEEEREIDLGEI